MLMLCLKILIFVRKHNIFGVSLDSKHIVHLFKGLIWVESRVYKLKDSFFDLSEVEQVVDKSLHQPQLPCYQVERLIGFSKERFVVLEELRHHFLQSNDEKENGGEGCPHLVTHGLCEVLCQLCTLVYFCQCEFSDARMNLLCHIGNENHGGTLP